MKNLIRTALVLLAIFSGYLVYAKYGLNSTNLNKTSSLNFLSKIQESTEPLSIERMRSQKYPGSDIVIEETLSTGGAYSSYITSYQSEGLKIFALLNIPNGEKPAGGWPVVVFNHGYIPPAQYRTNERYVGYVGGFANNGYIVFKPDYRGHGSSEGRAEGAYFSPAYTVDVLNAVSSIKRHPDANPEKIGMWGHSLGGNITQRAIAISTDIKAAVIWGGVVGSYDNMYDLWFNRRRNQNLTPSPLPTQETWRMTRTRFIDLHGSPESNPDYWNAIDPVKNLQYVSTPIQLHHTRGDETVTYRLSEEYAKELEAGNKEHELFLYEGDDHNISANFNLAMQRSVAFFDKHLK